MCAPDLYWLQSSCMWVPPGDGGHQLLVAADKNNKLGYSFLFTFCDNPIYLKTFLSYIWDPAQLCIVVVQEGMAFTVRVKLNIPQVEDARNDPKQVLHRMKICKSMQNQQGSVRGLNQCPTYTSVNVINVDDL